MTERIMCVNCGEQIYESGGKWWHLDTGRMACRVPTVATPPAVPSQSLEQLAREAADRAYDAGLIVVREGCGGPVSEDVAALTNHIVDAFAAAPSADDQLVPTESYVKDVGVDSWKLCAYYESEECAYKALRFLKRGIAPSQYAEFGARARQDRAEV